MSKSLPPMTFDDQHRFWSNVLKKDDPEQCWPWVLSSRGNGYGQIRIQGYSYKTHRVAYFLHYGDDPGELHVCHDCDNKACCNPHHLFLGTHQDNMADLKEKGGLVRLELDVAEIVRLSLYETQRAIAKRFGCSQRTIVKILHGIDYHRSIHLLNERKPDNADN